MGNIAKLGDASSHGGVIISASGAFTVDGVTGVVSGDMHQCPIQDHGTTAIQSSSTATGAGRAVVRSGDTAGCGAAIIGTGSATAA